MFYESTRGGRKGVSSAEAIKSGIAPDGGLYVPEESVTIKLEELQAMVSMTYQERALFVLRKFLTDYTVSELNDCIEGAYQFPKFDHEKIAPINKINQEISVLELWHGPTSAFKDMALQILPRLLVKAVEKTGETKEMVVLVATSGDTGKAAMEGFKDVSGTRIIVFFPEEGVSQIQKWQMVTQEGDNIAVFGMEGNFDDAQNGVKEIFSDLAFSKELEGNGFQLSSANSINWGRLAPQIIYYFSGYADLVAQGTIRLGETINVVVPTGNFGNILAAYYAKTMGLPINKLICASNENHVLADFIQTGKYDRKRDFVRTVSPSMDILISSNLERLLFLLTDRNAQEIKQMMEALATNGEYQVSNKVLDLLKKDFFGAWCSEEETIATIHGVHENYDYIIDTHTAVGFCAYEKYVTQTGDQSTKVMIASTASPFKFSESVCQAIFGIDAIAQMDEFDVQALLAEKGNLLVPIGLRDLNLKPIRFSDVCQSSEMLGKVESYLKNLGI
ncbi:MAG: threonine synthase [Clostridia bacterium]